MKAISEGSSMPVRLRYQQNTSTLSILPRPPNTSFNTQMYAHTSNSTKKSSLIQKTDAITVHEETTASRTKHLTTVRGTSQKPNIPQVGTTTRNDRPVSRTSWTWVKIKIQRAPYSRTPQNKRAFRFRSKPPIYLAHMIQHRGRRRHIAFMSKWHATNKRRLYRKHPNNTFIKKNTCKHQLNRRLTKNKHKKKLTNRKTIAIN